jgi:hypothetical protein
VIFKRQPATITCTYARPSTVHASVHKCTTLGIERSSTFVTRYTSALSDTRRPHMMHFRTRRMRHAAVDAGQARILPLPTQSSRIGLHSDTALSSEHDYTFLKITSEEMQSHQKRCMRVQLYWSHVPMSGSCLHSQREGETNSFHLLFSCTTSITQGWHARSVAVWAAVTRRRTQCTSICTLRLPKHPSMESNWLVNR